MGDHGFSARFCTQDGSGVTGLTYDPEPTPITYIWYLVDERPIRQPGQTDTIKPGLSGDEDNVTPVRVMRQRLGFGNEVSGRVSF